MDKELRTVEESWRRLASLLPEGSAFPEGISETQLSRVSAELSFSLPTPVRDFYLAHNGSGDIVLEPTDPKDSCHWILSFEQAYLEYRGNLEMRPYCEADPKRRDHPKEIEYTWWHDGWFPFTSNGGGDGLFVDFSPTPYGSSGQVVDWWHEGAKTTLVAENIVAWIDEMVIKCEIGNCRLLEARR